MKEDAADDLENNTENINGTAIDNDEPQTENNE